MNNSQETEEITETDLVENEILFTRGVLSFLNLVPKNIMLACGPYRFVAVLQTADFQRIRFVTPSSGLLEEALEKYHNIVSFRFVFAGLKEAPLSVPGTLDKILPYPPNKKYRLIEINLDDPLPERYKEMLTSVLEIEQKAKSRMEPRIRLVGTDKDYFGLNCSETLISIGGNAGRCYLRDLSASSASVIILNSYLPDLDDNVHLLLHLNSQFYPVELESRIIRANWYDKDKELIEIVLRFVPEKVPVAFYTFLEKIIKSSELEKYGRALAI